MVPFTNVFGLRFRMVNDIYHVKRITGPIMNIRFVVLCLTTSFFARTTASYVWFGVRLSNVCGMFVIHAVARG